MNRLAPADHAERQMYELGKMDERNAVIKTLQSKICENYHRGECVHGACWDFVAMIDELKRK